MLNENSKPKLSLEQEFEVMRYLTCIKENSEKLPKDTREEYLLGVIGDIYRDFFEYQKQVAEMYKKLAGL